MQDRESSSRVSAEDLPVVSTLLAEANGRSQFFMDKLWQIPMAYAAAAGITMSRASGPHGAIEATVAAVGLAVLVHMAAMLHGNRRATHNLIKLERALEIEQLELTYARILPWPYWLPVFFVPIAMIALAIWRLI